MSWTRSAFSPLNSDVVNLPLSGHELVFGQWGPFCYNHHINYNAHQLFLELKGSSYEKLLKRHWSETGRQQRRQSHDVTQQGLLTLPFKWQAWECRLDRIQHCYVLWCYTARYANTSIQLTCLGVQAGSDTALIWFRELIQTLPETVKHITTIIIYMKTTSGAIGFTFSFTHFTMAKWMWLCTSVQWEHKQKHTHTKMVICTRFYSLSCFVS